LRSSTLAWRSAALREAVRAMLGENMRKEQLARMMACSASNPYSNHGGQQPTITPCLASMSPTYCAASTPGWQAHEFETGRRVIGSARYPFSPCCFEWRDGGERGDETERVMSGHLTGVDICVVKKYVDHVSPRSVRRLGTR
jgi:hypothetical protein